jgi:hypothetical protein
VSTPDSYVAMTLTEFSSVGIVIIAIISLLVSDCSPLCLPAYFSSPQRTGVLLWDQGYQLVSIGTHVRPRHCPDTI